MPKESKRGTSRSSGEPTSGRFGQGNHTVLLTPPRDVGSDRVPLDVIVPIGAHVPVAQNAAVALVVDRMQADPVVMVGGVSPAALVSTTGTVHESMTTYWSGSVVMPMFSLGSAVPVAHTVLPGCWLGSESRSSEMVAVPDVPGTLIPVIVVPVTLRNAVPVTVPVTDVADRVMVVPEASVSVESGPIRGLLDPVVIVGANSPVAGEFVSKRTYRASVPETIRILQIG
jgi:hypothetical protein